MSKSRTYENLFNLVLKKLNKIVAQRQIISIGQINVKSVNIPTNLYQNTETDSVFYRAWLLLAGLHFRLKNDPELDVDAEWDRPFNSVIQQCNELLEMETPSQMRDRREAASLETRKCQMLDALKPKYAQHVIPEVRRMFNDFSLRYEVARFGATVQWLQEQIDEFEERAAGVVRAMQLAVRIPLTPTEFLSVVTSYDQVTVLYKPSEKLCTPSSALRLAGILGSDVVTTTTVPRIVLDQMGRRWELSDAEIEQAGVKHAVKALRWDSNRASDANMVPLNVGLPASKPKRTYTRRKPAAAPAPTMPIEGLAAVPAKRGRKAR